jgi:hypothetical protein
MLAIQTIAPQAGGHGRRRTADGDPNGRARADIDDDPFRGRSSATQVAGCAIAEGRVPGDMAEGRPAPGEFRPQPGLGLVAIAEPGQAPFGQADGLPVQEAIE